MNILSDNQRMQVQKQISAYEFVSEPTKISIPFDASVLDLIVDPKVASPDIMNSGVQVVKFLAEHPELVRGKVVVDMGTGCGILGVTASLLGAERVMLADIDQAAVSNALKNIELHDLGDNTEAFQSDLFNGFSGKPLADVQIFNHPFFAGEPEPGKEWTRMMLGGTELLGRYFEQAPQFSTRDAKYILPWLTTAGNDYALDNDPGKRGPEHGYRVVEEVAQEPVAMGIQQAYFKVYVLTR